MRYVIDQVKGNEQKMDMAILRLEIDYELLSLHDALQVEDTSEIIFRKDRLKELVAQLKYLAEYV